MLGLALVKRQEFAKGILELKKVCIHSPLMPFVSYIPKKFLHALRYITIIFVYNWEGRENRARQTFYF